MTTHSDLRQAVCALYGSDTEQRRAADAYLKAARSRDGFWVLALALLKQPSSLQEQFFAANALRMVAQRGRDLVAPESGRALVVELARLTVEAAASQQCPIANQLAGTLAELAIRAMWWGVDALVSDILQLLGATAVCEQQQQHHHHHHHHQQQQSGAAALGPGRLQAALLVLSALPEACQSKDVSVHPERRAAAAAALATCTAIPHLVQAALSQRAAPTSCQLAVLQLIQSWSALPGAASALQLAPGIVSGLHWAILASPALATQAAEAVAALYGACAAPHHPRCTALLQQLLPHLQVTVGAAIQEAAAQPEQRSTQLLNAAITILSAAGSTILSQLCDAMRGPKGGPAHRHGAGSGVSPRVEAHADGCHQHCHQQQQHSHGNGSVAAPLSHQNNLEAGAEQGLCAAWWEALGFVAACLLELLQHPDTELALSSLEPWDDSLLPGLEQLAQRAGQGAEQAQQLLGQLCGGLVQRMALPQGISSDEATADARDLPDDMRNVRRELSDTFRAAAGALGAVQAVQHLLDMAVHAHTAWHAAGPMRGWQQLEVALYALNLVLPRQLAQQAQQMQPAGGVVQQALGLCLAALDPSTPKLAGTALTLVGGLSDALVGFGGRAGDESSAAQAAQAAGSGSAAGSLLSELLQALLGLLESADDKLSRNAATAVHRLCCNARLAAKLAAQHAAWAYRLVALYCRRGSLQHGPCGGEDLSTEEFMLRALCHLARASGTAGQAQQGCAGAAGGGAGLQDLVLQLVGQAAAQAAAALSQLQQEQQQGAGAGPAAVAAAQRCGAQLEVVAVILECAASRGAPWAREQPLGEVWRVLQAAQQLLMPSHNQQQQPHLAPLLQGSCRVVASAVVAAPQPPVLHSALSLLLPLLADPAHPCLLEALRAVIGASVMVGAPWEVPCAAGDASANGLDIACGMCSQAAAATPQQQQQHPQQQGAEAVLPCLVEALTAGLQGSARHAGDPDWEVAALQLGAQAARQLPWPLLVGISSGGALLQQLLSMARQGAQSYHREVCEAMLAMAVALCSSSAAAAAAAVEARDGGSGHSAAAGGMAGAACMGRWEVCGWQTEAAEVGPPVTLWLLLGASGTMPPYMMQPIAEALHSMWGVAGRDRFQNWMSQAILQLAPADAPWRSWKAEAVHAMLADLLSQQSMGDAKRFKRLLKVLCGGKKKGQHVGVPARGQ